MRTLAEMVKEYKARRGLTWAQLEEEAGVSKGFLRRIGTAPPFPTMPPETAKILSRLLDVPPVVIILSHAEQNGLYNPAKDGVLTAADPVTILKQAVDLLEKQSTR